MYLYLHNVCNTYLYLLQFKLLVNIEICRERTVARFNVDISCSFVYHSVLPLAYPSSFSRPVTSSVIMPLSVVTETGSTHTDRLGKTLAKTRLSNANCCITVTFSRFCAAPLKSIMWLKHFQHFSVQLHLRKSFTSS